MSHLALIITGLVVGAALHLLNVLAGAMLPPLPGQERTRYGYIFRVAQLLASNSGKLEAALPAIARELAAEERPHIIHVQAPSAHQALELATDNSNQETTMIQIPLTPAQYAAKVAQLEQEQGIKLTGDSGTASKLGCVLDYEYDGRELSVTVKDKPFLISEKHVEAIVAGWLSSKPVPPKLSTTVASIVAIVLCFSLCFMTSGCTSQQLAQVKTVVGQIGAEIPNIQPLLSTAASVAASVDPADAPLVAGISSTVQVSLTELATLCNTYANNPSDTVWQSIIATVGSLVNNNANALLDAAHIKDPASRVLAQTALGGLQTALLIIDGYVQSARTKAQNQAAAQSRSVKLKQIEQFLNRPMVEDATNRSFDQVYGYEVSLGY